MKEIPSDRVIVYKNETDTNNNILSFSGQTNNICGRGDDTIKMCCKFCFIMMIIIILFIVKLILCSSLNSDLKENKIIIEIKKNIESQLIYSFNINSTSCQPGEESLVLGESGGTYEGCEINGEIKNETCPKNKKKSIRIYKTISPTNPIPFLKINSNYICVKKSKETYRELLKSNRIIAPNNECQSGFKSCGIIDTLGNKFCVKNEDICPINKYDIEIYTQNNLGNLGNDTNLFDSINRNNTQILSIFQLSENTPCINPEEKAWTYHYILEPQTQQCTTSIKDTLYDNRYEKLTWFNTTKHNLYRDNDLWYYTNKELAKENVFLYARNIIGFDAENIDKFYDENFFSLDEKIKNYTLAIYFIYLAPIGVLFLPCIRCRMRCSCYRCCICCFEEYLLVYYIFIFPIICIACLFIDVILNIILYQHSFNILSYLDFKGSDEYTNELSKILINEFSINTSISLGNIISSSIIIMILIITIGFFCLKNIKKTNNINNKIQTNNK